MLIIDINVLNVLKYLLLFIVHLLVSQTYWYIMTYIIRMCTCILCNKCCELVTASFIKFYIH